MKYCIYCKNELNDDAVYCTSCGKKQEKPKQQPVQQKDDGLGFGIVSICVCWFPILSIIFGILALVRGTKTNRTATIVCASIGLFLAVLALVLEIVVFVVSLSANMHQNCYPDGMGGWACYY